MSDWPPKPNQNPQSSQPLPPSDPARPEWQIIEKALLAATEEQRRARRWSLFFRFLVLGYLLLTLLFAMRACSSASSDEALQASENHLAVVDIEGTIGGDRGVDSQDAIKGLRRAFEASASKAVVLNINSPGGSPVQSDTIYREIRNLRAEHKDKKVYAVIGDTGASGAYYIAAAADEIWVSPASLVGSIGVIMPSYNIEGLSRKLGVEDRTMTSGQYKDILSLTRPMTDYERQHVQAMLTNVHNQFINAVKQGRGQRLKNDPNLFSGLFWSGEQSVALGLADRTGDIYDLSRALKVERRVDYTVGQDPFSQLFDRMGAAIGRGLGASIRLQLTEQTPEVPLQ